MRIKKIVFVDANILNGWAMSEYVPYDEIKFDRNVKLGEILNILNDSDFGYIIEVDLKHPVNKKVKTKNFPIAPENKKISPDKFTTSTNKNKSNTSTQSKNLLCDWNDEKNYLMLYRMLKFYVRHGMIVEEVREIISFRQNKWLEKYISFNTQKRNQAVDDFEKDF